MSIHRFSPPIADLSGPNASALDSTTFKRVLRPDHTGCFERFLVVVGVLGPAALVGRVDGVSADG
jgi:hypothetical protein